MRVKRDELRWTPEGLAALAEEKSNGTQLVQAAPASLPKSIAAAQKKQRPWWKAGLAKADAAGKRAAELAATWTPKAKLDPTKAALIASLLGGYDSDAVYPFVEHVLATKDGAFALRMMAQMWRYATSYDNPAWPKTETRTKLWLRAVEDDEDDDASVSYAKSSVAIYLERAGAARPALLAEMRAIAPALLAEATPQQRAPIIYATRDAKRANEMLKQIKANKLFTRFGSDYLAAVADDPKLVFHAWERPPGYVALERWGPALLPLYDKALDSTDKYTRGRWLAELANVYGPKTARIVARFVTMASQKQHVVAYFKRYPELLDDVLRDPKCADDHPYLESLKG